MKKRGLRRYYKKLARCNHVFDLLHNRTYKNFGYDYEHIHDYPADFSNFSSVPTITKSEILNYFQSKAKDGFNVYYSINCDNEPEILISHFEIGEPIITDERKEVTDETNSNGLS